MVLTEIFEVIRATIELDSTYTDTVLANFVYRAAARLASRIGVAFVVDRDALTIASEPDDKQAELLIVQTSILILNKKIIQCESKQYSIKSDTEQIDMKGSYSFLNDQFKNLNDELNILVYNYTTGQTIGSDVTLEEI